VLPLLSVQVFKFTPANITLAACTCIGHVYAPSASGAAACSICHADVVQTCTMSTAATLMISSALALQAQLQNQTNSVGELASVLEAARESQRITDGRVQRASQLVQATDARCCATAGALRATGNHEMTRVTWHCCDSLHVAAAHVMQAHLWGRQPGPAALQTWLVTRPRRDAPSPSG
jgi:hypothetical protein